MKDVGSCIVLGLESHLTFRKQEGIPSLLWLNDTRSWGLLCSVDTKGLTILRDIWTRDGLLNPMDVEKGMNLPGNMITGSRIGQ
jgi:hypothetical protein